LTDEGNILRMRLQGNVLVFIASARGETDQNFEASVSRIKNAIEHGNLTEIKVERAIAEVEDLIMPIIRGLPASKRLEIDGTEFVKVTHLLSGNHAAAIPIESVESLFNDLANYASGSPVAWRKHVPATQVALSLVVLREVMQHGGFKTVSLSRQAA